MSFLMDPFSSIRIIKMQNLLRETTFHLSLIHLVLVARTIQVYREKAEPLEMIIVCQLLVSLIVFLKMGKKKGRWRFITLILMLPLTLLGQLIQAYIHIMEVSTVYIFNFLTLLERERSEDTLKVAFCYRLTEALLVAVELIFRILLWDKSRNLFLDSALFILCAILSIFQLKLQSPQSAKAKNLIIELHSSRRVTSHGNKEQNPNRLYQESPSQNISSISSEEEEILDLKHIFSFIQEGILILEIKQSFQHQPQTQLYFQNKRNQELYSTDDQNILEFLSTLECKGLSADSSQPKRSGMLNSSAFVCSRASIGKLSLATPKVEQYELFRNISISSGHQTVIDVVLKLWKKKRFRYEAQQSTEFDKVEVTINSTSGPRTLSITLIIVGVNKVMLLSQEILYKDQLKKLLELNHSKSRTLSYVSHELRSPLNSMIFYLQNIKTDPALSADCSQKVQIVLENTYHILNLSNDLLDLAQIKADCIKLHESNFDLVRLAQECLNMFKLQAEQKGVLLNVETNLKKLFIKTDRNRLKQIVVNLISNSLKFTKKGIVSVVINQRCKNLVVGVKDSGVGISAEDQRKLFKAFGKIENEDAQNLNQQGIGLGLVISNKLAKLISGGLGIQVESNTKTNNHGSYFYFQLKIEDFHLNLKQTSCQLQSKLLINEYPRTPHSFGEIRDDVIELNRNLNTSHNTENEAGLTICYHILLVDDNMFNLKVLEFMLKEIDKTRYSDIDIAIDGSEAVYLASTKQCSLRCSGYHLIFMDLEMPIMDGLQASKLILQEKKHSKIIILSGHDELQTKLQCQSLGLNDYLTKPIAKASLQQLLKRLG